MVRVLPHSVLVGIVDVVQFQRDDLVVTQSPGGPIRAWSLADGAERFVWRVQDDPPAGSTRASEYAVTIQSDRFLMSIPVDSDYLDRRPAALVLGEHLYVVLPFRSDLVVWDLDCGCEQLTISGDPENRPHFLTHSWSGGSGELIVDLGSIVQVWDIQTRTLKRSFPVTPTDRSTTRLYPVPEHEGQSYFVRSSESVLELYDATTGEQRGRPPLENKAGAVFSEDGQTLVVQEDPDGGLTCHNLITGELAYRTATESPVCWGLSGFEEVTRLVMVFPDRIEIRSGRSGEVTWQCAFAPDDAGLVAQATGKMVIAPGGGTISLGGHSSFDVRGLTRIAGRLMTIMTDGEGIFVWDMEDGALHQAFSHGDGAARNGYLDSTSILLDDLDPPLVVTTGGDDVVRVWDLSAAPQRQGFLDDRGKIDNVALASVDGERCAVVVKHGGITAVVRLAGGSTQAHLRSRIERRFVHPLRPRFGTSHVIIGDSDSLLCWDFHTSTERDPLPAARKALWLVTAGHHEYAIGMDSKDDVWTRRLAGGDVHRPPAGHLPAAAIGHADGKGLLLTVSESERSWQTRDLDSGELKASWIHGTLPGENTASYGSLAVLGDQLVALTTSGDNVVHVWDAETGAGISRLTHPPDSRVVQLDAFIDEDGLCIVTATSDGTARVWDLDDEHEKYSTNLLLDGGDRFAIVQGALDVGGRQSLLTFDLSLRTAHLWDLRSGDRRKSWSVPDGPLTTTVAETPFGSALLIQANGALDKGAVSVWYLDNGPAEDASLLFPEPVAAVATDADGLVVAFAADFAVFDWPGV